MTAPGKPLRVLIADDHALIRQSLCQDLKREGFDVCAETATDTETVRAALTERPDVCLVDVRMPGGGLNAAEVIRQSLPATKIVMITALPDEHGVLAAARAGADGYLAKDISRQRLPLVIRAVAAGETSYPRRLLQPVLRALRSAERSGI